MILMFADVVVCHDRVYEYYLEHPPCVMVGRELDVGRRCWPYLGFDKVVVGMKQYLSGQHCHLESVCTYLHLRHDFTSRVFDGRTIFELC